MINLDYILILLIDHIINLFNSYMTYISFLFQLIITMIITRRI